MTFEIGDKVQTNSGLFIGGAWREAGAKGKVVRPENAMGVVTVKFKGVDDIRFIRPEYITLRKKANRPFKKGDTVALTEDVRHNAGEVSAGTYAEVVGLIPDSNRLRIKFLSGTELTVAEEFLSQTEAVADKSRLKEGDTVVFTKTYMIGGTVEVVKGVYADVVDTYPTRGEVLVEFDDYTTLTVPEDHLGFEDDYEGEEEEPEGEAVPDLFEVADNPEVQEALALILERIEEIKSLLTAGPRQEIHVTVNEASFVTPEAEEEPEPEPVFKKAKEVNEGDMMYTEGGAWDKVNRIETKDSGYTSLYGVFGNKIAQVPSGRVVQVLEPVS